MSYPIVRRYADEAGPEADARRSCRSTATRTTLAAPVAPASVTRVGPSFNGGYQVTVTSYGYTNNCRYLDGLQRIDIPSVQDWLKSEFNLSPAG